MGAIWGLRVHCLTRISIKKPFICLVPGAHSRVYIVIITHTPVSGLLSFEQFISDALIRLMENKIF